MFNVADAAFENAADEPLFVGAFDGEFLKLALTLILLAVAIVLYADLNWPSMLLSMAITLQVNFLALAKRT